MSRDIPVSAALAKRYELFNIQSKTYKVKDKQLFKAFTVVKGAFSYSGISKDLYYIGGGETHYKLCESIPFEGFKHGSPATTLDFDNVENFKELLRDADVNVVAVPGRLKPHALRERNYNCGKRDPAYNRKRDDWEYQRKTSNGTYYYQVCHRFHCNFRKVS
ncbi:unnamed protein product [Nippostrongylus brasiliensis]|uniref:Hemopexin n=1 Tax=Nippostrongylus brasiliensis TaxID=27835 RepID=A0A0N4XJQ9_NIPBR|nr:unnamed protein product [Nippostrongylus brasiliensis]